MLEHEQGVHKPTRRQGDPKVDTNYGCQRANDGNGPQPAIEQDVLADAVHGAHDQGDHGRLYAKERSAQRLKELQSEWKAAGPAPRSRLVHSSFTFGVLSMARSGDPNTNGSQFFVCLSRDGTSFLDTQYTTFGECIKGAEVIVKIAATPTNAEDRPMEPPVIKSVKLIDADPYGTGPARVNRP